MEAGRQIARNPRHPTVVSGFSSVVLAGGKSSRIGCDKAWLPVDGQPLLARQIQLARATGAEEILISGRADVDYSEFGCQVLRDRFPEAGPLAGIERALNEISFPLLMVLAVDMPNLTPGSLRQLIGRCRNSCGAIPRIKGRIEPLAAIYPKAAEPRAVTQLRQGNFSVAAFAERCVQSGMAEFQDLNANLANSFASWNLPTDVKRNVHR